MSREMHNVGDHRVATALAHPLRVAVLALLERGPASPTEMARELNTPVENLSYHVRKLRDLGFIEIYELAMARGAVKHTYRLVARPHIDENAWEAMPAVAREAIWSASIAESVRLVAAALQQGGMDRADSIFTRYGLTLDEEGFAEVSLILQRALKEALDAESRAEERLNAHTGTPCNGTVVLHFFGTPDMSAAAEQQGKPDGRRRTSPTSASTDSAKKRL